MKSVLLMFIVFATCARAQQYGWVRVAQLGNQFTNLNAVEFVDSLHGWTAEATDFIYRTTDGGNFWVGYPGSPMGVNSISMLDPLTGWCVGSQGTVRGKILHTTDGGLTWVSQLERDNRSYNGTAAQTFLRSTTSGSTRNFFPDTGKVVQTTNGGTTWDEQTIDSTIRAFGGVQFIDSVHGWITSISGCLLRTNDGGVGWDKLQTPVAFNAISFLDTARGWALASDQVHLTTDGGTTWQLLWCFCTPPDDLTGSSIAFVDTLNGWVFGTTFFQGDLAAAIYRTTDGGTNWYREHVGQARGVVGMMLDRYHGWAVGDGGAVFAYRQTTSVGERISETPHQFALRQNYPNPFNPSTSIEYEIVKRSKVRVTVYDLTGRVIRTLVEGDHEPGVYRIRFNASGLASGVYMYTMTAGDVSFTKQMVLIK